MHTLNRGLVEQHVAVYGRRDAHWMASWRAESLDVWTTLTLTVGQGQQDAMPYSSVHNSTAREERDDSRSSPILNGGQNRAWPTSASTPLIRSRYDTRERGRSRMKPRLLLFQRKNNYIYTYPRLFVRNRRYRIEFNPWRSFFHEIILQYSLARDWDLGSVSPKNELDPRDAFSGIEEYISWSRRVWTELERVRAPGTDGLAVAGHGLFAFRDHEAVVSLPWKLSSRTELDALRPPTYLSFNLFPLPPCLQSFSPRKKHDQGVIHGDRWSLAWWKKEKGMIYNRRCMVVRLRRRIQFSKIASSFSPRVRLKVIIQSNRIAKEKERKFATQGIYRSIHESWKSVE